MVEIKKLYKLLSNCMADDLKDKNNLLVGNGIITGRSIGFNKRKVEETKPIIASLLNEIGIVEKPLISLELLTKNKNGETWNNLLNIDDFKTLDLLLAYSDAAGFILNNTYVQQLNVNQIGELSSTVISFDGRQLVGDDAKWLEMIRLFSENMIFVPTGEEISKHLDGEIEKEEITQGTK